MKKITLIFLLLVAAASFASYRSNNDLKIILTNLTAKTDIKPGTLEYRINFLNILPVGSARFMPETEDAYSGKKILRLQAEAESIRLISPLFKAKAVIESLIDPKSGNPYIFKQKIEISGKPNAIKEVEYDQKNNVMKIAGSSRSTLADTQDPLSAIYNLRRMDFDNVKNFEMNINTNQKNYILTGSAAPGEVKLGNKVYRLAILMAEIKRRDKNPYHKSIVSMVLLKDAKNLPLLIKVFSSGALINVKLTDIK